MKLQKGLVISLVLIYATSAILLSSVQTDLSSQIKAEIPDILPDVFPEEKRPLEPPAEINEEYEDE